MYWAENKYVAKFYIFEYEWFHLYDFRPVPICSK